MRLMTLALVTAIAASSAAPAFADTAKPSPKPTAHAMMNDAMHGKIKKSSAMHRTMKADHMMGRPSPKPTKKPR